MKNSKKKSYKLFYSRNAFPNSVSTLNYSCRKNSFFKYFYTKMRMMNSLSESQIDFFSHLMLKNFISDSMMRYVKIS